VANNLSRFQDWAKRLRDGISTRKRTEVTVETDLVLIVRQRSSVRAWCQECGCEVDVVKAEILAGVAEPWFGNRVEQEKWHSLEDPEGTPLVCLKSLGKSM